MEVKVALPRKERREDGLEENIKPTLRPRPEHQVGSPPHRRDASSEGRDVDSIPRQPQSITRNVACRRVLLQHEAAENGDAVDVPERGAKPVSSTAEGQ